MENIMQLKRHILILWEPSIKCQNKLKKQKPKKTKQQLPQLLQKKEDNIKKHGKDDIFNFRYAFVCFYRVYAFHDDIFHTRKLN